MNLEVMSARAVKAAVGALAENFSRQSGVGVTFDFAPVGALEKKLAAGAAPDVVILSTAAIEAMDKAGLLVPGSRCTLGCTSVGVAVKADAAAPDISTPESFKHALLAARAISVSDPAVGGTTARYLPELFARIGIADALEPKLIRCSSGGDVAERVARGEAELGMTFISEILPIAGVRVAGPLPVPYGNDTTYCAGVPRSGRDHEAAMAFIAALAGPNTQDVWNKAGFALAG